MEGVLSSMWKDLGDFGRLFLALVLMVPVSWYIFSKYIRSQKRFAINDDLVRAQSTINERIDKIELRIHDLVAKDDFQQLKSGVDEILAKLTNLNLDIINQINDVNIKMTKIKTENDTRYALQEIKK